MKRTALIAALVVVAIFGVVAYAYAASQTVAVTAANPARVELTVSTNSLDLGTLYPDVPSTGSVALSGKSNRAASLTAAVTVGTFDSLSQTLSGDGVSGVKGGSLDWTSDVSGSVNWDNENDPVSGSILYTFVQD